MISRRSLRLRLGLAGAVSVGLALVAAFFGLSLLFERHVERRVVAELRLHLDQVIAGLDGKGATDAAGQGLAVIRPPLDPRFDMPLSGLYWQVEAPGMSLQSRSLWDQTLPLPQEAAAGPRQITLAGPGGHPLMVLMRGIRTDRLVGDRQIVAAVAIDRGEVAGAVAQFRRDLLPYLLLLAILLLAASIAQIVIGLRPLSLLRERIAAIRSGDLQRLGSAYPDEVLPLTAEVDGLLQSREAQLKKARERAAELAHGFKTPLQALTGDVMRLKQAGQVKIAADIEGVILSMRRLVDQEMARARIADRAQSARADLARVAASVVSVISRTPAGRTVALVSTVPDGLLVRIEGDDLSELLGNLVENAVRYAKTSVAIGAERVGETVRVTVRDDGPGIPPEKLADVLRRGARLDTTSGGAGLGLSIAENITETAGGTLSLENGERGLVATLTLPAVARRQA